MLGCTLHSCGSYCSSLVPTSLKLESRSLWTEHTRSSVCLWNQSVAFKTSIIQPIADVHHSAQAVGGRSSSRFLLWLSEAVQSSPARALRWHTLCCCCRRGLFAFQAVEDELWAAARKKRRGMSRSEFGSMPRERKDWHWLFCSADAPPLIGQIFPSVWLNTSASTLLWHRAGPPWTLWQSTSNGPLYCLCPANRANPSCPRGQGRDAFSFIAQCSVINCRVAHCSPLQNSLLTVPCIVSWRARCGLS